MYWLRGLRKTFSKKFISEAAFVKVTDKFYLDRWYHGKICFLRGFFNGETEKMILRSSEVEKVIQYYFSKYKGENCYKLYSRIRDSFAGVNKHGIQEWINSNRKHYGSHTILKIKICFKSVPRMCFKLIWWSRNNVQQKCITTKHISIS